MQKFHYALSGFRYHKKMSAFFFVFISLFLFVLTFLFALSAIEVLTFKQLKSQLNFLDSFYHGFSQTVLKIATSNHRTALQEYDSWRLYILTFFFVGSLIVQFIFLYCRRNEIKSLYLIKKRAIIVIGQFFFEAMIPLMLSLCLVITTIFILQNSFWQNVQQINVSLCDKSHLQSTGSLVGPQEDVAPAGDSQVLYTFNDSTIMTDVATIQYPSAAKALKLVGLSFLCLTLLLVVSNLLITTTFTLFLCIRKP